MNVSIFSDQNRLCLIFRQLQYAWSNHPGNLILQLKGSQIILSTYFVPGTDTMCFILSFVNQTIKIKQKIEVHKNGGKEFEKCGCF